MSVSASMNRLCGAKQYLIIVDASRFPRKCRLNTISPSLKAVAAKFTQNRGQCVERKDVTKRIRPQHNAMIERDATIYSDSLRTTGQLRIQHREDAVRRGMTNTFGVVAVSECNERMITEFKCWNTFVLLRITIVHRRCAVAVYPQNVWIFCNAKGAAVMTDYPAIS